MLFRSCLSLDAPSLPVSVSVVFCDHSAYLSIIMMASSDGNKPPSPPLTSVDSQGVHSVSMKLPDFYTNDPEAWFIQVEAQFGILSVNQDETKYDLAALDSDNSALCYQACP